MQASGPAELQGRIGIAFRDLRLLQQALVHRSYLNENAAFPLASNERLEFLGDAVLGFVVAARLFREYPELSEGELTALRAALVRTETLAQAAEKMELGEHLYLGRGEESTGGRQRQLTLARTLEAIIGAVFLDQGLAAAATFIDRILEAELAASVDEKLAKDFKSRLQELVQAARSTTPVYRTIGATGPDHAKVFTIEVVAGDEVLGRGAGRTKQAAEQEAARQALEVLEGRL